VKIAMEGLLPPTLVEKQNGKAEVRVIFKVKGTVVAGCYVTRGRSCARRSAPRARRRVVWDGKISSLKRFKDDAKEVAEGFECGISLDGFNDLKEKDVIECYEVEESSRSCEPLVVRTMFVGVSPADVSRPARAVAEGQAARRAKFRDRVRLASTCRSPRSPSRICCSARSSG
jgi:hypothetical protein